MHQRLSRVTERARDSKEAKSVDFAGAGRGLELITAEISESRFPGVSGLNDLIQFRLRWYRHPGSNGGPLDPQSSALTN
jgi:hypothetical protein